MTQDVIYKITAFLCLTSSIQCFLQISGDDAGYWFKDKNLNISYNFDMPGELILTFPDGSNQYFNNVTTGQTNLGLGSYNLDPPGLYEVILIVRGQGSAGNSMNLTKHLIAVVEENVSNLTILVNKVYIPINTSVTIEIQLTEGTSPFLFIDFGDAINFLDVCNGSGFDFTLQHSYNTAGLYNITVDATNLLGSLEQTIQIIVIDDLLGIGLNCPNPGPTGVIITCTIDFPDNKIFPPNAVVATYITDYNCSEIDPASLIGGSVPFNCWFETQGDYAIKINLTSDINTSNVSTEARIWDSIEVTMNAEKYELRVDEETTLSFINLGSQGINYRLTSDDLFVELVDESKYTEPYSSTTIQNRNVSFSNVGNFTVHLEIWNKLYNATQDIHILVQHPIPECRIQPVTSANLYVPVKVIFEIYAESNTTHPDLTDATCTLDFGDGSPKEDTTASISFQDNGLAYQTEHTYSTAAVLLVNLYCFNKVSNTTTSIYLETYELFPNISLSSVYVPFNDATNTSEFVTISIVNVPLSVKDEVFVSLDFGDGQSLNQSVNSFPLTKSYNQRGNFSLSWIHAFGGSRIAHAPIDIIVGIINIVYMSDASPGIVDVSTYSFSIGSLIKPFNLSTNWSELTVYDTDINSKILDHKFQTPGEHIITISLETAIGTDLVVEKRMLYTNLDALQILTRQAYSINETIEMKVTIPAGEKSVSDLNCTFGSDTGTELRYGNIDEITSDIMVSTIYREPGTVSFLVVCVNPVDTREINVTFVIKDGCFNSSTVFPEYLKDVNSPLKLYLPTSKVIKANVQLLDECINNSVSYTWTIAQNASSGFDDVAPVPTSMDSILIGNYILDGGLYRLSVHAETTSTIQDEITDFFYIRFSQYPIFANVVGARLRQTVFGTIMELDAAKLSYDPLVGIGRTDNLVFTWQCFVITDQNQAIQYVTPESTDDGYNVYPECGTSLPSTGIVQVDTSYLELSKTALFKVSVMKGNRVTDYLLGAFITDPNQLAVDIRCVWNCLEKVVPKDLLLLEAVVTCDSCSQQQLDSIKYKWTLKKNHTEEVTIWPSEIVTDASNVKFQALGGALQDDQYTLLLEAFIGGQKSGRAVYFLKMNEEPYGGTCTINPTEGIGSETLFDLICENWKDEGTRSKRDDQLDIGEPIFYKVEQKILGTTFMIYEGENGITRNLTFRSCPEIDSYICSISIRISDMFKAEVSLTFSVKITNPLADILTNSSISLQDAIGPILDSVEPINSNETVIDSAKQAGDVISNILQVIKVNSLSVEGVVNGADPITDGKSILQQVTTINTNMQTLEKAVDKMTAIIDQAIEIASSRPTEPSDITSLANSLAVAIQNPAVVSKEAQTMVLENANLLTNLLNSQFNKQVVLKDVMDPLNALNALADNLIALGSPSITDYSTDFDPSTLDPSLAIEAREGYNTLEADFYRDIIIRNVKLQNAGKIDNANFSVETISNLLLTVTQLLEDITPVGTNNTIRKDNFELTVIKDNTSGILQSTLIEPFSFKHDLNETVVFKMTKYKKNIYVQGKLSPLIDSDVIVVNITNTEAQPIDARGAALTFKDPTVIPYSYVHPEFIPGDAAHMFYFRFLYRDLSEFVCIGIKPTDMKAKYRLYWRSAIPPSDIEYDTKHDDVNIIFVQNEYQACSKPGYLKRSGVAYAGIQPYIDDGVSLRRKRASPNTNQTVNNDDILASDFFVRLISLACFTWDGVMAVWDSTSCELIRDSPNNRTDCKCGKQFNKPTAISFHSPPNTIDFVTVFSKFDIQSQAAVLIVIIVCTIVAIFCSLWGHWRDKMDTLQWGVTLLADNYAEDSYFYLITVYTGSRRHAGTKSQVSFNICGDNGETGIRKLSDGVRKDIRAGSVMHFLMATPSCVGPLQYLHIWHDNSGNGNDASWYLDKVEIRDLQRQEKFEFPCSLWLAVEEGTLEKALPIAGYEDMSALKTILYKYAAKHVSDDHIWLSLLLRPVKSHFTRVQRVFCCYALLMLTMIANAMFFDQVENKDREQKSDFKMGSIRFNMQDLYISLISVIITALPIYVIMVLFQKSKLNISKEAKKPCCLPPFYRKVYEDSIQLDKVLVMKGLVDDEDGVLPHFFIYVAWFLVFVSSFLSAFFLLLYSIEWGQSLSELWLTSFFLSIFESIILVDPFKVLVLAFTLALFVKILKKQTPTKFDLESIKELVQRRGKSFALRRRLVHNSPFSAEDLAEAKSRRTKDVKMQRASKDLVLNSLFAWILFSISFSNRSQMSYTLKTNIGNQLLEPPKGFISFEHINQSGHYFNWLNETVIPTLFPLTEYNGKALTPTERLLISDNANYKVGPPRLRQLRGKKGNCTIPYIGNTMCVDAYDSTEEMSTDFCIGWKEGPCSEEELLSFSHSSWKYISPNDVWGLPIVGLFGIYSGGGYVADLDINRVVAQETLNELFKHSWIDRHTRAIFLEFTLFNVNLNVFSYVSILAEFPETGSVLKFTNTFPFRTSHTFGSLGGYVFLCEIVFIILAAYMTITIIMKLSKMRFAYFKSFWEVVELVCLMFSVVAVALYMVRMDYTQQAMARFKENKRMFVNFYHVVIWDNAFIYVLSFLVAIATLRLLKVMGYTKRTITVYLVLKESSSILPGFVFYVFLALTSFATLGFFLFGRNATSYKDLVTALETTFRGMLGDATFKMTETTVEDSWITTLYFVGFVWIIILTLSNLFLAILLDVMAIADQGKKKSGDERDMEIFNYIWSNFIKIVHRGNRSGSTPVGIQDVNVKVNTPDLPPLDLATENRIDQIMRRYKQNVFTRRQDGY